MKAEQKILRKYEVDITFEFGKEPVAEIKKLEKKLGITASHKGKLFYRLGTFDFFVAFDKLEKKQALQVIDAFSESSNFRCINVYHEEENL